MRKVLIDRHIEDVVGILKKKSLSLDNVGLLKGKTGIVLFLFLYSRYSGDKETMAFAINQINHIIDSIETDTPTDYSEGLAGFGTAMEYLLRKGYLDTDMNKVLDSLDILIKNGLKSGTCKSEITGYGKYFVTRIIGRTDCNDRDAEQKSLESIFSWLLTPPGSYSGIMGIIELLSDMYNLRSCPDEIANYIDKLTGLLEDSVCKDISFGSYPGTFNPLTAAFILLKVFEKTGMATCRNKALLFLEKYGKNFVRYLDNDSSGLISGSFKWAVLYRYIATQLPDEGYDKLADVWLERCLEKKELMAEHYNGFPPGALDGYAGIGLSLLYLVNGISDDWMDIIPLFYERGKVTYIH